LVILQRCYDIPAQYLLFINYVKIQAKRKITNAVQDAIYRENEEFIQGELSQQEVRSWHHRVTFAYSALTFPFTILENI